MKDKVVAGGIAGIIGASVQNVYSYIVKSANLTEVTYSDFATTVLTNRVYSGLLGFVAGFLAYLAVGVILGLGLMCIISLTGSNYLYLKSILYSFVLWFILTGFGTIFNLPTFVNLDPISSLSILVGGLIFGVVTAFTMNRLDRNTNLL